MRLRIRTIFWSGLRARSSLRLFVKFGTDFLEFILQIIVGPFHRFGIVLFDRFAHRGDGVFHLLLLVAGNLVAQFLQLLIALISKVIGVVLDLDRFLRLLVLLGVGFGFALHLLDLFLRKPGAAGDRNLLFLAGAQIFR